MFSRAFQCPVVDKRTASAGNSSTCWAAVVNVISTEQILCFYFGTIITIYAIPYSCMSSSSPWTSSPSPFLHCAHQTHCSQTSPSSSPSTPLAHHFDANQGLTSQFLTSHGVPDLMSRSCPSPRAQQIKPWLKAMSLAKSGASISCSSNSIRSRIVGNGIVSSHNPCGLRS